MYVVVCKVITRLPCTCIHDQLQLLCTQEKIHFCSFLKLLLAYYYWLPMQCANISIYISVLVGANATTLSYQQTL